MSSPVHIIAYAGTGNPVTTPNAGPAAPGGVSIVSVQVTDTPQTGTKTFTVVYAPPSPLGTFVTGGIDVWLDMPDTSGQLSIADGTVPADGTVQAVGMFSPVFQTFFPYIVGQYQTSFIVAAPSAPVLARVYITSASQNAQISPVQHETPGETPSYQVLVTPPLAPGVGTEFAALIQNLALNATAGSGFDVSNPEIQISDSGDQYFVFSVVWGWLNRAVSRLGGVSIVLQDDTHNTRAVVATVPFPPLPPGQIGFQSVFGTTQGLFTSNPITVRPGTTQCSVFLVSFDTSGNTNSLAPGVTPQVDFQVVRSTGAAGIEYTSLVTGDGSHAFITVTPVPGADGSQLLQVDGYWQNMFGTASADPTFGGAQIVVDKGGGAGPIYSVVKGTLAPIENDISQPASAQTWAFYLRSIDINGRGNSITPQIQITGGGGSGAAYAPVVVGGVLTSCSQLDTGSGYSGTPTATLVDGAGNPIPGVSLTAVVTSNAVSSITVNTGGANIVATPQTILAVGNSSGVLNLAKSASSSFSSQFAIVAGAYTAVAFNANILTTGTLKVGNNGSGVPIEIDVYDHLNNLIGWIGDDTANSGFVGGWFKQLRVGGSSPSGAPFVADTSGNLAITNAVITVTTNSVITQLINSTLAIPGFVLGLSVQSAAWPSAGTGITGIDPFGIYGYSPSTSNQQFQLFSQLSGGGLLTTFDGTGSISNAHRSDVSFNKLLVGALSSSAPSAGSKQFWYDPSDGNRVKYVP